MLTARVRILIMENLVIKGTANSPEIIFKPAEGIFEISGESRPENASQFFKPVFKWIEDFSAECKSKKEGAQTAYRFTFRLEYMNSISTKLFYDLLKLLEVIPPPRIIVDWHYQDEDIDMQENGEEYARLLKLKFEFHLWKG
jgi:hypothetical protein